MKILKIVGLLAFGLLSSSVYPSQPVVQKRNEFSHEMRAFLGRLYDLPEEIFTLPEDLHYIIVRKCTNPLLPLALSEPCSVDYVGEYHWCALSFSPDSSNVVCVFRNSWKMFSCDEQGRLELHHEFKDEIPRDNENTLQHEFSSDGRKFAYRVDLRKLMVLDLTTKEEKEIVGSPIDCFTFKDVNTLVVVAEDWLPHLVTLENNDVVSLTRMRDKQALQSGQGLRTSAKFRSLQTAAAQDGTIITVGRRGGVYRYNHEKNKETQIDEDMRFGVLFKCCFSSDKTHLFVIGGRTSVKCINLEDGTVQSINISGEDAEARKIIGLKGISCSGDGSRSLVFARERKGNAFYLLGQDLQVLGSFVPPYNPDITTLSPQGDFVVSSGKRGLSLFDSRTGLYLANTSPNDCFKDAESVCACSSDGKFFALTSTKKIGLTIIHCFFGRVISC